MPYIEHLKKDKNLAKLVVAHGRLDLASNKNVFLSLCGSIISQQLSTKVAAIIYKRFLDLFKGKEPRPKDVISLKVGQLRQIGLSNSKVNYINNVAEFAMEAGLESNKMNRMTEVDIIAYLTQIKGVGRWTAEMIMMFSLGKQDVFALDDLGIQQAMQKLYKIKSDDKKLVKEKMVAQSKKWIPYRTYACMYLWRWIDGEKKKVVSKKKKTV